MYLKFSMHFYVFLWPIAGFLVPLPVIEEKYIWRPIAFCLAYVVGVTIGYFLFKRKVKPLPDPIKELIKEIKANGKVTGEVLETKDFLKED